MGAKIVVAGVASLSMAVPVERFPVPYRPTCRPAWLRAGVAGVAAHVATILRTLGDDVRLCTVAGSDPAGDLIRADLRARGLLGPGVINGPESSLSVALVAPDGSRRGHPHLAAVNAVRYPAEVFRQQAEGADLAVLTNARFVRPLLRHAEQLGVPVAVDVHLISDVADAYNRPWLEVADIVFCSHERLPCATAEWMARIFGRYPGCAIAGVGMGERGCALGLRDGRLVQVSAVAPRGVVNTAGAGDSLFASFLHGWLAAGNPVDALGTAAVHAGWKVGDTFPSAASLTENEIEQLTASHPVETTLGRWDAV